MFPLMEGAEFEGLFADIQKHGLREPLTVYEDKILDGRNRERAAVEAGVELSFHHFSGSHDDARAFVISKNIHRRHLTFDQKQELVAALIISDPAKSDRQIAKLTKVSPTSVGKKRRRLETTGEVSTVDTRKDARGHRQPASKARKTPASRTQKSPKAQEIEEQQIRNVEMNADFSPPADLNVRLPEPAPEPADDDTLIAAIMLVLKQKWDTRDQLIKIVIEAAKRRRGLAQGRQT
jgi:ParB-like chromosome segregation protein Spo0J